MDEKIKGYTRVISEIAPARSDSELYSSVVGKAESTMSKKRLNKKAVIIPIAAALACALSVGTAAVVMNYEHLTSIFGGNQSLTSEIQNSVFEDSDGHVTVTIDQFISDGRFSHAAVHYKALDERGRQWLENTDFDCHMLNIGYSFDDGGDIPTLHTGGCKEITEQRTETDRYYHLENEYFYYVWYNEALEGTFCYYLTGGRKTAAIDISSTMEFRNYKIVGDERSSKYLTPTMLEISPLSYVVYAHDDYGLIKREDKEEGGWREYITISLEEQLKEIIDKEFRLVMADGEEIQLAPSMGGNYGEKSIWNFGPIYGQEYWKTYQPDFTQEIDFDNLKGLKIDDVYYDLTAE